MTTWNYRIVRFKDKTCRNGVYYKVQEVYYNEQNIPNGYCDIGIGGETIKECFMGDVQHILEGMRHAYLKYPEDFSSNQSGSDYQRKLLKKDSKSRKKVNVGVAE